MDFIEQERFKQWLKENTNLLQSSMGVYIRIINRFYKLYSDLSKENINKYISSGFRDSYCFHIKFAFKHYLKFKNKKNIYDNLIEVRKRHRKRVNLTIPKQHVLNIIESVDDLLYKDWASLCYYTGARAFEIISLKEENIDFNYSNEVIKIRLEGKGGKQRITFIKKERKQLIDKYLRGKAGYLFLPYFEDKEDYIRKINTLRTYFYVALKKAGLKQGYDNFGTHQLRRCFADDLRKAKKDIRTVQKALGHSNISTTSEYFSDDPEEVKEAVLEHQDD